MIIEIFHDLAADHPDHDFPAHVTSEGGGDFFTHQVVVFREDDA